MTEQLSIPEINLLWDRVSARMASDGQAGALPPEARRPDPLYGILCVEGEMALRYERLSRRIGNKNMTGLAAKLYKNQLSLVKKMASAVFLRSGRIPEFRLSERPDGEIMEQLREYALWELGQAESYKKYIPEAERGLKDILYEGQKCKEQNAALLGEIIEDFIVVRDTYSRMPPRREL